MKKTLAILTAILFVLMLVPSVFAAGENITKKASVSASSEDLSNADDTHPASNLIDGDTASYWQAASGKNKGEYFTLTFSDKYDFDRLVIHWGGGSVKEGEFTVSVSEDGRTFTDVNVSKSREDVDDTHHNDTAAMSGVSGKAIRVTAGECSKEQLQCWEVEVFGSKSAVEGGSAGENEGGSAGENEGGSAGESEGPVPEKTGVESVAMWAVLFAVAALAAVFTVRKVRA